MGLNVGSPCYAAAYGAKAQIRLACGAFQFPHNPDIQPLRLGNWQDSALVWASAPLPEPAIWGNGVRPCPDIPRNPT